MAIGVRKSVVVGVAGVVAAGALWLGANAALAEGDRLSGWPVGVAAAASGGDGIVGSKARVRGANVVVRTRSVREAFVDVGRQGESAGDFILFEERVLATRSDRVIGRDAVRCEVGLRTFTCEATIRINGKGKIRVAGSLFRERDNVLPVTGGTGTYRNVGGVLRFFDLADGDTLLVFHLTR